MAESSTEPHQADMLIQGANLVTPKGKTGVRGSCMSWVHFIPNASIAIRDHKIAGVGTATEVEKFFPAQTAIHKLDVKGMLVTPALVDCHTHPLWAGSRAREFAKRLTGVSYQQIMAEGGGILSTVHATRAASDSELEILAKKRMQRMHIYGTATLEVKSGYGLMPDEELRHLGILKKIKQNSPAPIFITCLGAHALPAEYAGQPDKFIDLIINELLPRAKDLCDFVDVFCDEGAFTLAQAQRVLTKGKELGMGLRIHADEFASLGAVELAVEMGALSADHLHATTDSDIKKLAKSDTVAVLLPATSFFLKEKKYAPARDFIDNDAILALASDFNPGSANCEALQSSMILAALHLGMTPEEILTAVTINGAAALGYAGQSGSLEVGKRADIAIWDIPTLAELIQNWGVNHLQILILDGETFHIGSFNVI